jgi:hypothetical protein
MFQVIDFAQLTMDSHLRGNDNLVRFFEARVVVQRSFYFELTFAMNALFRKRFTLIDEQ